MNVLHAKTAKGTIDAIGKRLEDAVKAHKFGVIGVIDLQAKIGGDEARIAFDEGQQLARLDRRPLRMLRRLRLAHASAVALDLPGPLGPGLARPPRAPSTPRPQGIGAQAAARA